MTLSDGGLFQVENRELHGPLWESACVRQGRLGATVAGAE